MSGTEEPFLAGGAYSSGRLDRQFPYDTGSKSLERDASDVFRGLRAGGKHGLFIVATGVI